MSDFAIGIDLGTSTSVISVYENGKITSIPDPLSKSPITPSIVALNAKGELIVGHAAKTYGLPDAKIREAKRTMGTPQVYTLGEHSLRSEEVGALVLKYLAEYASQYLRHEIFQAVISIPAYFGDPQRQATINAAQLAGIKVLRLISEPSAAALAFGIDNLDTEEQLLVFDFGGGTLDVTILEMIEGVLEVKASHGDDRLGGSDIDAAICNWAQSGSGLSPESATAKDEIKDKSEEAKKMIASMSEVPIAVSNFATSSGREVDLSENFTRADFQILMEPFLSRSTAVIDETLRKASKSKSDISRVILVGGSTYIPAVRQIVETHLQCPIVTGVDPDLAVSQGAAISAALALGKVEGEKSLVYQDAATRGFGTYAVHDVGSQPMLLYDQLMKPNAQIPYSTKATYSLLRLDQDICEITLVEDATGRAMRPGDSGLFESARAEIQDIPPSTYGIPHKVEIEFQYDQNHVVQMKARIPATNQNVVLTKDYGDRLLSYDQHGATSLKLDSLWQNSPLATRNKSLIRKAEEVLRTNPLNGELIEATLVDLKAKVASNDVEGASEVRERLSDLLSEL